MDADSAAAGSDGKIVSEAVSITQPAKIDANKFKVPSNYKMK